MFDEKHVTVNGYRTRYLEAGQGQPLVLIHGGNIGGYSFANDWTPVVDLFARDFRVIIPDNLGCGFTDLPRSPEDYRIGSLVEHNAALLGQLGIDHAHVVGHSRGGYIATRLALDYPALVDCLTIVSSASLMIPPNPIYLQWEAEAEAAGLASTVDRLRYVMGQNSYSDRHLDREFVELMASVVDSPNSTKAKELLDGGLREQFNADLTAVQQEARSMIADGRLSCPTLVIWAWEDPSATMKYCGIPCMELVLGATRAAQMHILTQSGHWSFREQPNAFAAAVSGFIRSSFSAAPAGTIASVVD